MKEYPSKKPNEHHGPVKVIKVNYTIEDMLARGCATAEQVSDFLNRIIQKAGK